MAKNSKFGPMKQCTVHFGPFWRSQILVDLAGLQTPPRYDEGYQTPPLYDTGHWIPPPMRRIRASLWTATNFTLKSQSLPGHTI